MYFCQKLNGQIIGDYYIGTVRKNWTVELKQMDGDGDKLSPTEIAKTIGRSISVIDL